MPRAAIVDEDGESSVFVIEPAPVKPATPSAIKAKPGEAAAADRAKSAAPAFVARRRIVKTGYADGDRIEIRDGIQDGERVITIGRNAVRDGTEVQVLDATPAAVSEKAK